MEIDAWAIAGQVWSHSAQELLRLQEAVDRLSFEKVVEMISATHGRIVTAGVGTSAAVARKIAHSLSCIERPSFFLSPGDAVHGALGAVQPGDVAILISKGGGTSEILALLPALETKQIPIIAVTEGEDSQLARHATILLRLAVAHEADEFNMLATTSAMVVTAVFDALCIAVMRRTGFTKEQFAIIHPGGAVGARLRSR